MRAETFKSRSMVCALAAIATVFASGEAFAQQQINLTAAPALATLPDGSAVPMWGYSCDATQVAGSTATCAALNPAAAATPGTWSPVVITVPTGADLRINLTNNLTFQPPTPAGGQTPPANNIPTSLVIVGQLGGGLGLGGTTALSPTHAPVPNTWFLAGNTNGPTFSPPAQGPRVQSFATEVSVGSLTATALCWGAGCPVPTPALRPGTYLIESGTHPSIQGPMGLYGILVVTAAPTTTTTPPTPGTAYPGVNYAAEVALMFSEIDPGQNNAVDLAVRTAGFNETSARVVRDSIAAVAPTLDANKKPLAGTGYQAGDPVTFTKGSVCTTPPTSGTVGTVDATGAILTINYTGGQGCSDIPTATSDKTLNPLVHGTGAQITVAMVLSSVGQCSGLANGTPVPACYPPAVNYTPLYYLINGVAFDRNNALSSTFNAAPAAGVTGNVLVRIVNAGLRMHVPSIVGSTTTLTGPTFPGLSLIAEDGNPLPGVTRVQSEVFMAAGKTYDVMVDAPPAGSPALPIYDRELSLSGNAISRDSGMLAYISVNGGAAPSLPAATAVANADTYNVIPIQALTVSNPSKGVIGNDVNVYNVRVLTAPTQGTVTLNADGTFIYLPCTAAVPACAAWTGDSFVYRANGSGPTATVTLNLCTTGNSCLEAGTGIAVNNTSYTAAMATFLQINPPGVLSVDSDAAGYPLTVDLTTVTPGSGLILAVDVNGGFKATVPGAGTYQFTYKAKNSQGTQSGKGGTNNDGTATVTLVFPQANGPTVQVLDGADKTTVINDYRWIIEEDRTFYADPKCALNPASCLGGAPLAFGTNFHPSSMPVVATGCTGPLSCEGGQTLQGAPVVCDLGNGVCEADPNKVGHIAVLPSQAALDPKKRYYISVLPGDSANPFIGGNVSAPSSCKAGPYNPDGSLNTNCGHGMGGASFKALPVGTTPNASLMVLTQPSPYPTGKLTVFVFEDDFPLNGEHDSGGGIDVIAPQEPGLGGFNIILFDAAGGTGDFTGQPTYDMFNQPLTNSLAGTIDPASGNDACPISPKVTQNVLHGDGTQKGIVGMIVTCPTYESDGQTKSPLAGQAVVPNLYAGRYSVVATPGADRIARGEEWLQTNTLDGQKAHDAFIRIAEPPYFQEFGPAGYHVSIGFANPDIINNRRSNSAHTGMCDPAPQGGGLNCNNTVTGMVTLARMSRTPDERLYSSGSRDGLAFTQCFVSLGDPDGADFAFAKCDSKGRFTFTGIPAGNWKAAIFDQWNDQIVDGITAPIALANAPAGGMTLNLGEIATHQWQINLYTRTFLDMNGNGVSDRDPLTGADTELGLALVPTNIRFRDGSFSNFNNTDLNGYAAFNEVFPLFNWYVVEADTSRFKSTGVHVVYDSGGPTDGTIYCQNDPTKPGYAPCGPANTPYNNFANTYEKNPLPAALSIPGAVYCGDATCLNDKASFASGTAVPSGANSTGRIDPPFWFGTYGFQGFSGQSQFLEFGKKPYAAGETGGIFGHVMYASTRPFDDPRFATQNSWVPLMPNVTINLYKEGFAADGVTPTLTLIDTTKTSSFDDWAQGFRSDGLPNMNCPGQTTNDPFWSAMQGQPVYLDWYNSVFNSGTLHTVPNGSQFKCYDGMHNWNQLQPAPYDGLYRFPSITALDPKTGKPTGSNCSACVLNPDISDKYRFGTPMLPAGKYVVEVVPPSGFEVVKEEDKNILIGDNYIAPVTVQFPGLGSNIFIMPDQAAVGTAFNPNNPQNATSGLGQMEPFGGVDAQKTQEYAWPCVGASRVVPDFMGIYPLSGEVAPFAGATRNLCDRKEVTVTDQTASLAQFGLFTPIHIASHFTGQITDDFAAEFDPFSPQFGEKFAPSFLPVSIKDWAGNEVSRTNADQFGVYNGLNYSTWEVDPPNPTGYAPTMMVMCMNDRGSGPVPDPLYQPTYSQFCYELPFMPGQTGYFDTPVVPTSAFSEGYNHADCNYSDATPAIASVTSSDIAGPWVSAAGHTLTITALGDQLVENPAWAGPQAAPPFNTQKITRHYGFGTTAGVVTIGGVPAPLAGPWSDTLLTVTVPTGVAPCALKQQTLYGGSAASCGQLVITNGTSGKQSIDTVTVTIGGQKPTVLLPNTTIQSAIDVAKPGDMIIVPPGIYNEMLLMWKPVRLQGVGAASSVVNGSAHPAGKLDPWRKQVTCLFGLTVDGRPSSDPSCNAGWTAASGGPAFPTMLVDRVPMEGIVGWDASVNGNLAEQLIEPSLMGAYEGAAISVVGKGVNIPAGSTDPYGSGGTESQFPAGTTLLSAEDCLTDDGTNPYPTNYYCNPSSIDGLDLSNSSQGGGGIFVHAWGHHIQIANNRIHNNTGTLGGGITIGQGEHVDLTLVGAGVTTIPPGSCESAGVTNQGLPFCYNMHVHIHHNSVSLNSSMGDELFSSTSAGAGGVSINNGADYYHLARNWVCGNMSTGDGGGVSHIGWSKNGRIEHNTIVFNQSTNPTIATNGGGLLIMGAPDADPPCNTTTDKDCVTPTPQLNQVAPGDGTGLDLVVDANLIVGNGADSGSGGGVRLQHVNGQDVLHFPNGLFACASQATCLWNSVKITNNIIANNVAGWDGAGISLVDALAVDIVNNTVVSNDSTAASGVLFDSLFAPLASSEGTNTTCTVNSGAGSCPQVAGVVSVTNSSILKANLPATGFTCPLVHGALSPPYAGLDSCRYYSVPVLANNVIWQNRSFVIGIGPLGSGTTSQQNQVGIFNASFSSAPATPVISQSSTGQCPAGSSYWDVGVRGDTGPVGHASISGGPTLKLTPVYSALSSGDYNNTNLSSNPQLTSQYCNGSRSLPEICAGVSTGDCLGKIYTIPGTNEVNAWPSPVFSLTPSATVDEGNNWVNIRWGPLALNKPTDPTVQLGNFVPVAGSPAIDFIAPSALTYALAPARDYFGNPRPAFAGEYIDIGAIESQTRPPLPTVTSINPASYARNSVVSVTLTGTNLATVKTVSVSGAGVTVSAVTGGNGTTSTATFTIASDAPLSTRTVTVTTAGGSATVPFTVAAPFLSSITPSTSLRGVTGLAVTIAGQGLLGATAVNIGGINLACVTTGTPTSTTVTASCGITAAASAGAKNVTVLTPGGTAGGVQFTVRAPTLTSIAPAQGQRGGSAVTVTLTGADLTTVNNVLVSGLGVTASGVTVQNDNTVTATLTIAPTANLGNRNVTVTTTSAGASNAVTFAVLNPPLATLTSINPTSGLRGTAVPVTLTGTNFTPAGTAVSASGLTVSGVTVVSSTQITATLTIDNAAGLGGHNVAVTTPSGSTAAVTFTVNGPTLTSISPTSGVRGTNVAVTLNGSNLSGATAVTVSGTGATCTGVTSTATTVNATCTITNAAALGARTVTATTPIGTTNAVSFTVTGATATIGAPAPVLTSTPANTATKNGTITVSNAASATAPLTLTANPTVAIVGPAVGTFSIVGGLLGGTCVPGAVVNPGSSCTINVAYAPGLSTATATANVTITDTGMATASQTSANFTAN